MCLELLRIRHGEPVRFAKRALRSRTRFGHCGHPVAWATVTARRDPRVAKRLVISCAPGMAKRLGPVVRGLLGGAAVVLACGQARHSTDAMPDAGTGGSPTAGGGPASSSGGRSDKVTPSPGFGGAVVVTTGGAMASGGSNVDVPLRCVVDDISVAARVPLSVEVLVQASESMNQPALADDDDLSRWSRAREVLLDPDTGVLAALRQERVGFSIFASALDDIDSDFCVSWASLAPPALENFEEIAESYPARPPGDRQSPLAPLDDAIRRKLSEIDQLPRTGPVVLLVVTDGEVSGCDEGDTIEAAQSRAIETVELAFEEGITTLVLDVGGSQTGFAQALASAGQGAPDGETPRRYFDYEDGAELKEAFASVLSIARSCEIEFNGNVTPERAPTGRIALDGQLLTHEDPNGWRLNQPSTLELRGDACAVWLDGQAHTLRVSFPGSWCGEG